MDARPQQFNLPRFGVLSALSDFSSLALTKSCEEADYPHFIV